MANQADFPVRTLCRVLKVSASGFYAWRDRKPSQRMIQNAVLTEQIRAVHAASDGAYGRARIRAELFDQGVCASNKRIGRLMRLARIRGVSRRRGFIVTTRRDPGLGRAPDLVRRRFLAGSPNQLWVADMTYVPTWGGIHLSGRGHRCLEPTRRRLVDRRTHARRTRAGRLEHGDRDTQT